MFGETIPRRSFRNEHTNMRVAMSKPFIRSVNKLNQASNNLNRFHEWDLMCLITFNENPLDCRRLNERTAMH